MRIFCALKHSRDPQLYYGGLWSGNFYPALRQLGHEVIESQMDLLPTSRFMHVPDDFTPQESELRAQTTESILRELRAEHQRKPVDLFLSYFYNSHFDPGGFSELRRLGIPSVNFYCNSIYQFDLVQQIAPAADFAWHAERDARDRYLAVGAHPVWVQMGADPSVYSPAPEVTRDHSACFVGQRYADRDRWAAALVGARIPLDLYGPGWGSKGDERPVEERDALPPDVGRAQPAPGTWRSYRALLHQLIGDHGVVAGVRRAAKQLRYKRETQSLSQLLYPHAKGPIQFEDVRRVFSQHEVVLNFSNVWADGQPGSDLIPHVRLRDFEAPMCRSCYLTGETDEIREFYEVGKEIDTYSTKGELVEKTGFYLAHPDAAEKLREAGYRRALCDHTWVNRFREVFRKTGLDNVE